MIPKGKVTTYGAIARAAGGGGQAARSVTAILGKAYDTGVTQIPFHRIVYAGGRVWINTTHHTDRMRLYKAEGIAIDERGYIVDFDKKMYTFG